MKLNKNNNIYAIEKYRKQLNFNGYFSNIATTFL